MTHSLTSAELDALTQSMADQADAAAAKDAWQECHTWQAAITLIEAARKDSFLRRARRRDARRISPPAPAALPAMAWNQ